MESVLQDLRYAFRSLRRRPGFAAAAVLSLAIGIGANATIFTVMNAAFLKPLPVDDVDGLVAVYGTDESYPGYLPVSFLNFEYLRDNNEVLASLASVQWLGMNLTGGETPERIFGQMVSGSYFDVLGVRAAVGRTFLPEDDSAPGRNPVVVLSHGLWQRRFGSDPGLVGRTVRLNGRELTVIGIAPRSFTGTDRITACDAWVPMSMYAQVSRFRDQVQDRSFRMFNMVGRLKSGVSASGADVALRALAEQLERAYLQENKGLGAAVFPLAQASLDPNSRQAFLRGGIFLMIVVGLLLMITCANLASLLLARAVTRQREVGVRLAIGASRGRLIRQLLTESLVLSLVGGAVALLIAFWGGRVIWQLRPPFLTDDTPLELALDGRVLGFTLLISLITGLLFGLAPALQASRTNLSSSLSVAPLLRGGKRKFGLLDTLSLVQIGLTLVSLIGAGLFLRSLTNFQRVDVGFDADKLLVMSFDMAAQGWDEARGRDFYRRAVERAASVPGVEAVALGSHRPLSRVGVLLPVRVEGQEASENEPLVRADSVGLGYFEALGIPIVKGRDFMPFDRQGAVRTVIVNQTMARHYWPGQDPIGKRFSIDDGARPLEVVGVARDSKYVDLGEPPQPYFYLPLEQSYAPTMTLWVRTSRPAALIGNVRGEVQALAADLPLTDVQTVEERLSGSLWAPRLGASLLTSFGGLALVLATIGIYGVTAYSVTQRRREIGIRMALGAQRRDILILMLRQALVVILLGLTLGIVVALSGSKLIAGMLYGVDSADVGTFAVVSAIFATVALLASLLPAKRATRLDTLTVLRSE